MLPWYLAARAWTRAAARLAAGLALGAGCLAQAGAVAGEQAGAGVPEAAALEQAVKAAYLYNFAKFVEWPADSPLARAPELTIGVLADEAFARSVYDTVRGKRVGGRRLVIRRFADADEAEPCAMLFVGRAFADALPRLRTRLSGWPVLTVSDVPGFADAGSGIIGLFLEEGRVRFAVDDAAARASGLTVSSKLLRLSRPPSGRACAACVTPLARER